MKSGLVVVVEIVPDEFALDVARRVNDGNRFAGLFATSKRDGSTLLLALICDERLMTMVQTRLAPGEHSYPALTPLVPAASWYEREIHDLFGLEPVGHPRLDSLVLPLVQGEELRPRPGNGLTDLGALTPDSSPLLGHVAGEGVFTIPYGPVRSGVFESIEYLVETVGEDIVHLRSRVYHKHRGIERRFEDLGVNEGVLLAERVEGTVSIAHAMAYSQAVESMTSTELPKSALLVRVLHAELERIVNHLDTIIRHTEGASQAVGYARMSLHKERIMRLRSRICGHRFGRGVVVPGGVSGPLSCDAVEVLRDIEAINRSLTSDLVALMTTPSFLDRLRGTGILSDELVAAHGGLGPLARASGLEQDVRRVRPYGAYTFLDPKQISPPTTGDALARQWVRLEEIDQSFALIVEVLAQIKELPHGPWRVEIPVVDGLGLSWVEAPQGELLYLIEIESGRLVRVKPRCPSFHNLSLLPAAFNGDIFTDFVFIEASFGFSVAGVSG